MTKRTNQTKPATTIRRRTTNDETGKQHITFQTSRAVYDFDLFQKMFDVTLHLPDVSFLSQLLYLALAIVVVIRYKDQRSGQQKLLPRWFHRLSSKHQLFLLGALALGIQQLYINLASIPRRGEMVLHF
jgi:hypothetical protein